MEELIIKKIIGGLMGMKNKTKEPKEVAMWLNKLKPINPGMYEDYFNKYKLLVRKDQAYTINNSIFKYK